MWNNEIEQMMDAVTCPCCGLSCDDLKIEVSDGQLKSIQNGCHLARAFYDTAFHHTDQDPMIDGRATTLEEALDYGTELLRQARSPLFAGLATDVNGMRGILALADRCGATLDHLNGDAMFRNLRVVQDNGWFTTTFTEVRNRADLILLVGSQCIDRFPRLVERVLHPEESLFVETNQRRIILLGPWQQDDIPTELAQLNPMVIATDIESLSDAVGLLRGLVADRPVDSDRLGDDLGNSLTALAEQLKAAKYSVISWSAAELTMAHAELVVQSLVDLVKALNAKTRSAALPLAGTQADITANQVCTWQLGYPLRTRLQRGYPEHDPSLFRWQDLLTSGESDLLLWVSSFSSLATPPPTKTPTIVLGHAGMMFEQQPSLYIPVGVPGIDHRGHWYRSDGVCSLPLGKLRDIGLPAVSLIVNQLNERLLPFADEPESAPAC
ncbi:MAG: formylmethanofuran dehydrogenase subunit B [Candidatus Thiodiazotropha sp. (ex Codakia orbicularis)]|nr:formylmethanofuran dehydrogenase subunit B [Candidatus Thiodiazotropha sp. (ex Codakia orbicularis)]